MSKITVHLAVLSAPFFPGVKAPAQKVKPSPYRLVQAVRLSEVKWTDGFWKPRYTTCRDKMVPSMWEIMKGKEYKPFLEHFRIAAGPAEGDYHGAKWNDGDFYKWMEAVCALQAVESDPEWDQRLDEIIAILATDKGQVAGYRF